MMDACQNEIGVVLVVGPRQRRGRLESLVESRQISFICAETPAEAMRALRSRPDIELVLLAYNETVEEYVELCRSIKFDQRTRLTGVICLARAEHMYDSMELYGAGVDECIWEGASEAELEIRVRRALDRQRMNRSLDDASAVITSLATAIEGKDHYTCGHVDRVGSYAMEIGRRIGLDAAGLEALKTGGIVHDIGKVIIPEPILNKPGKLTDEEMKIMQRHPVIGYEILQPLRSFRDVLPIVRWHHEKPNGRGYPDGLKDDDLPLLPRIAAVADVFDALSTDRPYRAAFSLEKCAAILKEQGETGDLDAVLVEVMLQILNVQLPDKSSAAA
ncbi:MAG: HD domain-containing protein [Phycisphaerales bacterium]|nr:HD domain-containing protein [Phycisphaerales bacterium]